MSEPEYAEAIAANSAESKRRRMARIGGRRFSFNQRAFLKDVVSYVYAMIHPRIREVNVNLFSYFEQNALFTAISLLVLFGIRLKYLD